MKGKRHRLETGSFYCRIYRVTIYSAVIACGQHQVHELRVAGKNRSPESSRLLCWGRVDIAKRSQ